MQAVISVVAVIDPTSWYRTRTGELLRPIEQGSGGLANYWQVIDALGGSEASPRWVPAGYLATSCEPSAPVELLAMGTRVLWNESLVEVEFDLGLDTVRVGEIGEDGETTGRTAVAPRTELRR